MSQSYAYWKHNFAISMKGVQTGLLIAFEIFWFIFIIWFVYILLCVNQIIL